MKKEELDFFSSYEEFASKEDFSRTVDLLAKKYPKDARDLYLGSDLFLNFNRADIMVQQKRDYRIFAQDEKDDSHWTVGIESLKKDGLIAWISCNQTGWKYRYLDKYIKETLARMGYDLLNVEEVGSGNFIARKQY